ncbi:MAG: SUMF1/EgtB/PvdO family nonheme iron enzyme, partial [Acidobacteria bacterium]|nr:SUMF1/EgtB/PvdO family nonheme iron enzyme [Acidobacteriota bacterium]
RAARGGLEQRTYPWGDEYSPADLKPNGFGVYAVAYNLWEWTSDWYAPDYFSKSSREDPAGPSSGDFRVLRGGGFRSDPASATCYSRGSARPSTSSPYVTFRVMKTGANPLQELTRAPAAPAAAVAPAPTRPTDMAAVPPPPPPASGLSVTALAFEQVGGQLQIHLATTGKPAYRAFALASPDRIVIDLEGVVQQISKGSGSVLVEQGGVKQIRYSQFQLDPPITRAVIDLDHALKHQVEASDNQVVIRLSPAN